MMKKILSLCLALVMLLGMVVMPASADDETTEGTETTETAASVLTDEQQADLAAITLEQVATSGKYNLKGIGPWYYAQAGIDVSDFLGENVSATLNSLRDHGTASTYYPMLVANSMNEVLPLEDFQIGDLLIVRTSIPSEVEGEEPDGHYWVALFRGEGHAEGEFVVETRSAISDFECSYAELYGMKDAPTFEDQGVTFDAWSEYAVLRPSAYLVKHSYNVALGEDISLDFIFNGLSKYKTVDVEIFEDGVVVETIYDVEVKDDGTATAPFSGLTPADVDTQYTATVVNTKFSITHSVLDYCESALTNMDVSNEAWSLIVDLMNYAAAAQAYLGIDVTANTGLTDLQKMFSSIAPSVDTLQPNETLDTQTLALEWTSVAPALGESVAYRFFYEYEGNVEDLTFCVGETEITPVFGTYNGSPYVEYGVRPDKLLEDVEIIAMKGDEVVSASKTFSFGRYASEILTNDKYASMTELKNLVNSILSYNVSAADYTSKTAANTLTTSIQKTGTVSIQLSNKFDAYRKIMNLADLEKEAILGAEVGYQAGAAYNAVGLDITNATLCGGTEWTTYTQVGSAVFNNRPWSSSGIATKVTTTTDAGYVDAFSSMLVPNSWGGSRATIGDGTDYSLKSVSYQMGDLVIMRRKAPLDGGTSQYYHLTALYQGLNADGEEQFIVGFFNASTKSTYCAQLTLSQLDAYCVKDSSFQVYDVDGGAHTMTTTEGAVGWWVMRPSVLPSRELARGALTEGEKVALSKLTGVDDFGHYGYANFVRWAFNQIGVDVSEYFSEAGGRMIHENLISSNKPDASEKYYKVLVEDSWGGKTEIATTENKQTEWLVGDVFLGRIDKDDSASGFNEYYAFIYQGNGKFLVNGGRETNTGPSSKFSSTVVTTVTFPYDVVTGTDAETGEDITNTISTIYDYASWAWYYTFRFDQLFD